MHNNYDSQGEQTADEEGMTLPPEVVAPSASTSDAENEESSWPLPWSKVLTARMDELLSIDKIARRSELTISVLFLRL